MPNASDFPQYTKLSYQRDGAARASFVADIEEMLAAGKRKLSQFSEEAKATLDSALSVKRNDLGSLDLGVPQLREAASAQQARAVAAREVAEALAITAREEGKYTQEVRQSIAAAKALAREEEVAAQAALARANAAEQVQERLNRQASATDLVMNATKRGTEANHMMVNSVRSQRVAFVQAGQQMQDMAIQFQMGTKASTILAQQLPQLGFAFSGLAGNANKALDRLGQFGTFIAGPWGALLTIGLVALGPLVDKILESGEEADKASKRHRTLSEVLMDQKASIKEVVEATEEYIRTQQKARDVDVLSIMSTANAIAANLNKASSIREVISAELERQKTFATSPENMQSGPNAMAAIQAGIRQSEAALAEQNAKIEALNKSAGEVAIQAAAAAADLMTDPEKRLKTGFEILRKQVKESGDSVDVMKNKLADLNRQEKAALDAMRASRKESASAMSVAAEAAFTSPLKSYSVSSGFRAQRKGYKHQGIDMEAREGTPIYAPQAGTVDFAGAAGNYGNLIKLAHGAGTETRFGHLSKFAVAQGQTVSQGDIIGYVGSTGRSTGPHLHYEVRVNGKLVDPSKGRFPMDESKVAEAAQKAAETLKRFGDNAVDDIARINAQFDEAPRLIDQAAAATDRLNELISDLSDKKPLGWEQMVKDAEAAKGTIQDALVRPYRELRQESERRIEIEALLAAGREDEVEALRTIWQLESRIGPVSEQRRAAILDQVKYERQITEELRARQDIIGAYLDASRSVKQELVSIFSGSGSIGNLQTVFKQLNAQIMVEKIFGPMFNDLDRWVKEQSGVTSSVDFFSDETKRAGTEAGNLANALSAAGKAIAGGGPNGSGTSAFDAAFAPLFGKPANDNQAQDIVVMAKAVEQSNTALGLEPDRFFTEMQKRISSPIVESLNMLGLSLPGRIGNALGGAFAGSMVGGSLGAGIGLFDGLFGSNLMGAAMPGLQSASIVQALAGSFGLGLNPGGSQLGGLIGMAIPGIGPVLGALGGGLIGGNSGSLIGGGVGALGGLAMGALMGGGSAAAGGAMAGAALGPVGAVVGLVLGGIIGSLFKSAKYGNASFSNGVMNVNTNKSDLNAGASSAGNDLLSSLNSIADALDASLGAFNVSLGQTDGKWRISTTGRTGELKSKYSDVTVFGTGEEAYKAALQAAIADAISDGAITGISQAAQNILKAGGDLQKAIEKAALIQSIPRQLKQMTDPVGYAIDELNREFAKVVDALQLGSASAAEYADAEKLYNLKRAEAIRQASEQVMGSLKSLYEDLTVGNEALSLRDRLTGAYSKYNPLAERVAAGDSTAYGDFADAARTLLDLERQLNGSQGGYFSLLQSVTALSKSEMDRQQAMIDAASSSANPFSSNAIAANDNQGVIDAIAQSNNLLSAINQNMILMLQTGTGGGYSYDMSGFSVGMYY